MAETAEKKNDTAAADRKDERKPEPTDEISVTRHRARISGKQVAYTVTCGTMVMKEEAEKEGKSEGEKARTKVFFIAYTRDDVKDKRGAPDHVLVQRRARAPPRCGCTWACSGRDAWRSTTRGTHPRRPAGSWTTSTRCSTTRTSSSSIPVGTGYSRMVEGEKVKEYHEYKRDLESVGAFIRLYTSRYERWASPKYLIGESYGTTRASGLAGHLLERYGMYLNGVMLVSCALDFQVLRFDHANDLPHVLFLPTYAATAWYHKRLAPDLQRKALEKLIDEVEAFAAGEYAAGALPGRAARAEGAQGARGEGRALHGAFAPSTSSAPTCASRSSASARSCCATRAARSGAWTRATPATTATRRAMEFEFDPAMAEILGAVLGGHERLRAPRARASRPTCPTRSSSRSTWTGAGARTTRTAIVAVGETLRKALTMNPRMRVLVASGYYDLATPHFAADYSLDHLGIPPHLRNNIEVSYYEAGHMMYAHKPSLEKLAGLLRRFVKG